MSLTVYRINALLSSLLRSLPVGTNLAMFYLCWTLLSGRLLITRGAVVPALAAAGLPDAAVRRSWAALAYGRWEIGPLVAALERQIRAEGVWQPHLHDGYRPVAGDLTGFFRSRWQGCVTSHYSAEAGKAVPAVPIALAVRVGSTCGQRVPVPALILRPDPADPREATLQRTLLTRIAALLEEHEVFVGDAGFPISQVLAAHVPRFVVCVPRNFTARRATLPAYRGKGRPPEKGEIVRPLARTYQGKGIPATPPDHTETWRERGRVVRADFWFDLVASDGRPGDPTFACVAIHHPRYRQPQLLGVRLPVRGEGAGEGAPPSPAEPTARPRVSGAGVRGLYRDRWPVEQMPLAAKQMLGAQRQFVFGPEAPQRLPELALWAGALLMYEAATQPVIRTGFWDRRPQATIGRLRRALSVTSFADWRPVDAQFRKKASPTAHLPKGVLGHRRHKPEKIREEVLRLAA